MTLFLLGASGMLNVCLVLVLVANYLQDRQT